MKVRTGYPGLNFRYYRPYLSNTEAQLEDAQIMAGQAETKTTRLVWTTIRTIRL